MYSCFQGQKVDASQLASIAPSHAVLSTQSVNNNSKYDPNIRPEILQDPVKAFEAFKESYPKSNVSCSLAFLHNAFEYYYS